MQVTVKGDQLTIVIPINNPATPSSSGKTLLVASTQGAVKTGLKVEGKELTVNLNAYVSAK